MYGLTHNPVALLGLVSSCKVERALYRAGLCILDVAAFAARKLCAGEGAVSTTEHASDARRGAVQPLDTPEKRAAFGGWRWVAAKANEIADATVAPYAARAIDRATKSALLRSIASNLDEAIPSGAPWVAEMVDGAVRVAWAQFSEMAEGLARELSR